MREKETQEANIQNMMMTSTKNEICLIKNFMQVIEMIHLLIRARFCRGALFLCKSCIIGHNSILPYLFINIYLSIRKLL